MLKFKVWLENTGISVYGTQVNNVADMRKEMDKPRQFGKLSVWGNDVNDHVIQGNMAHAIQRIYGNLEMLNKLVEAMRTDPFVVKYVRNNLQNWDERRFWTVIGELQKLKVIEPPGTIDHQAPFNPTVKPENVALNRTNVYTQSYNQ